MTGSSQPAADRIEVRDLELSSHIGVPDAERSEPQRLTVNITLTPANAFTGLGDDIARTVDYFALTRRVRKLSAERPRKLIETLVEEIAQCCLTEFAVRNVEVELRKYILPDTSYVAVRVHRARHPDPA
jgi:dihydroneopterin aldolase